MSHIHPLKFYMVLLCIFYALMTSNTVMAIEEPKFIVVEKEKSFELRAYPPKIIAEVFVDANMRESSSKGFRLIADFIFGNNTTASGKSEKISMTAPVGIQEIKSGWNVNFVMPSQYTLDTLPKPNNPQVNIKPIPAKRFAVIIFSGLVDEVKMHHKVKELKEWILNKNLKPISDPELARYNPPWTLPFLRRNEIMIEVN